MIQKFFMATLLLIVFPSFGVADLTSLKCEQKIDDFDNLELAYTNITLDIKWYQADSDPTIDGKVVSGNVNLLFWNKLYYGKVISLYGTDAINNVLRHLQKENGNPIQRDRERVYQWITEDKIILIKRFSLHLGQVEAYCKELYEKRYDDQSTLEK